jgi:putative nucleotidyltransferase with HDIG domain
MDKVDRYIERVQHLPPAPRVVAQLLALSRDPNRDAERLAELIGYDPSLAAEVLKRSNSAFFRGTEPAADVFEAANRLGLLEVDSVVAAVMGAPTPAAARLESVLDTASLWWHSVATAVAADALADRVQGTEPKAYTAGLLHDLGKLAFAAIEGAAYADLIRQAGPSGAALVRAEEGRLGMTHAEVGARLLARWGLPEDITLAVLYHHRSPAAAAPSEQLAATVHLANHLAHHLAAGPRPESDPAAEIAEVLATLRLAANDLPEVMMQIRERLQRIGASLPTDPPAAPGPTP